MKCYILETQTPSILLAAASQLNIDRVITHDGIFHPDDVVATAVVSIFTSHKFISIVRTRSEEIIQNGQTSLDTVILDVGRIYDPEMGQFDHHQPSFTLTRKGTNIPYSSAGLVWEHLANDRISSISVWQYLDDILIKPIDMLDNGIQLTADNSFADAFTTMIHSFNPTWLEDSSADAMEKLFFDAVLWARTALIKMMESKLAEDRAENYVNAAFYRSELCGKQVVWLESYAPWQETLCKHPDPLFVIYPDTNGKEYRLQAVPESKDSFVSRKLLPKAWAGLNGSDLDDATGVKGCVFCHKGRFIAGNTTVEGIVSMAIAAVDNVYDM